MKKAKEGTDRRLSTAGDEAEGCSYAAAVIEEKTLKWKENKA